jgi:DNA-binding GntR family transcriptional regulator
MLQSQAETSGLVPVDKPDTRTDQVYRQIRHLLLSGALTAGEKMTTRGLADAMQVSGTPAREALGRLVAEGALEFGANRTVQVPLLTPEQIDEIYDARILLESLIIESAVPRRTEAQIAVLERIYAEHVAAIAAEDFRASVRLNFEFKFAIYQAANRPTILRIIEGLWLRTGPHIRFVYPPSGNSEIFLQYHADCLLAMKAGDVVRTKSALVRDLMEAQGRLRLAVATIHPAPRRSSQDLAKMEF